MKFGTDGKLYVAVGDVGRRGWTQNLSNGPATTPPLIDDSFGGPAPDNAHLTGVVLRLNADGSAAADSPFFAAGAAIGGEVGANVQKIFSYSSRNSFGMSFDPVTGQLWNAENGDDAYDEINRVVPGANSGWIQLMGPLARFADFKEIETASANGLGQDRFTPDRLAADGTAALAALFALPGSAYSDPEFSWRYGIAPSALGFLSGNGLGATYNGSMFIGAGSTALEDGYLMRLSLTADRLAFDTSADPRLADLVADNLAKFGGTESETLLFGRGFGIVTDIVTGPNGHLFVTSLSNGAIYEIAPAGSEEPPVPASAPASIALLGVGLAALLRRRRA
jgi:aldose sugar dehydrogenase